LTGRRESGDMAAIGRRSRGVASATHDDPLWRRAPFYLFTDWENTWLLPRRLLRLRLPSKGWRRCGAHDAVSRGVRHITTVGRAAQGAPELPGDSAKCHLRLVKCFFLLLGVLVFWLWRGLGGVLHAGRRHYSGGAAGCGASPRAAHKRVQDTERGAWRACCQATPHSHRHLLLLRGWFTLGGTLSVARRHGAIFVLLRLRGSRGAQGALSCGALLT
jgi:hypothetical protein